MLFILLCVLCSKSHLNFKHVLSRTVLFYPSNSNILVYLKLHFIFGEIMIIVSLNIFGSSGPADYCRNREHIVTLWQLTVAAHISCNDLRRYVTACWCFRQPVPQLGWSQLPTACPGHDAGEEELQEERLRPPDAGGFLLHVLCGEISGNQLTVISQHGSRSAEVLHLTHIHQKLRKMSRKCSEIKYIVLLFSLLRLPPHTGHDWRSDLWSFPKQCRLLLSLLIAAGVKWSGSPVCSVCRRFLELHEEHRDRLYEVEAPGDWSQRRNIWLSIQLGRYSLSMGLWFRHVSLAVNEISPSPEEAQRNEGTLLVSESDHCFLCWNNL